VQQAAAAALIGELAASSLTMAVSLLEDGALQGLVVAAANTDYAEAQLAACKTLRLLASLVPEASEALGKHLGRTLFASLMVRAGSARERSSVF
jgi:hypothetical protein